jgi:uncharacterized membrane protein YraQ (UPF0718 family)
MYPRYYIFVNFAGFLIIFGLLIDPIKAIAISVVAALMINIVICLMIKPLIECALTEAEERIKAELKKDVDKVIGYETEAINRRIRNLVYEALNKTTYF